MTVRRSLAAAGLLLALAGCSSSPTQPVVTTLLGSLTLTPQGDTLFVSQSQTFVAAASDTDGNPVTNPSLRWSSTNTAVATVGNSGVVRAVAEGTSLVVVSSGDLSDTAFVLVVPTETGWFRQTSGTSFDLNGVFILPDGNSGWAVGDGGRIIATQDAGATWAVQVSNTSFVLNAVWFTSATEGWAVGGSGTVLHTLDAGEQWTRVNASSSEALYDVVFTSRDTGFVVGSNGVTLRTYDRGTSWQKVYPTAYTLRGVSFAGSQDGWAVGDGGTIAGTHDGGRSWFLLQPALVSSSLRSVWRTSFEAANAVGDQGAAPRTVTTPDSVAWELQNAGAGSQLEGVHFIDDFLGWTVGFNGTGIVLRSLDGGLTWESQIANSQYRLNDVYFIDTYRGWAVGSNGTVIHTVTGGAP